MTTFEVGIICDDGEQATICVHEGATDAEIEQEALEQGHKFVAVDWIKPWVNPLSKEYLANPF